MTTSLGSLVQAIAQRSLASSAESGEVPDPDMVKAQEELIHTSRERCRKLTEMPERVLRLLGLARATDAVKAVREFLANDSRTLLVLAGGTGCGKTVAACVGLDEYLLLEGWSYRRAGRFVKAIDLVRAGTFDREFWDGYAATPMLVVDDLGTEPLDEKGWALANLAALIDKRYDACRKTILTTNLDVAKFKARYCAADGGRLIDRLREAGAFVEFDGASLRSAS